MDSNANNNGENENCETDMQETLVSTSDNVAKIQHIASRAEQISASRIEGLDEFFARPVRIASGTWTVGTKLDQVYDVYNLWANNKAVRAKLRNFSLFRGNLRIRVVVNATKFHYGYLMASYIPFRVQNKVYNSISAYTGNDQRTCYKSQSPDVGYMMVNDNGTLEMDCPFIYYNNYFRLGAVGASGEIPKATELFTDSQGIYLGELYLRGVSPLLSSSIATDPAQYTVMAWMTGVEMFPPTVTDMKLESGEDEFNPSGPISSVASAIARAAGQISSAPVVGPFALATSRLSEGVARFSALFGFSRPLIIENHKFVKEYAYGNEAVSNGADTSYSLALDVKREMTQDQSIVGDSKDPMDLELICNREAWINELSWLKTNTEGTSLYTYPCFGLYSVFANNKADSTQMTHMLTPMAFAISNFEYYRCTLVFRFVCVCSGFHRGRLYISYEPDPNNGSVIGTTDIDMNNQFGTVWDIQSQNEIMIEVPFCSDLAMLTKPPHIPWDSSWSPGVGNSLGTQSESSNFVDLDREVFGWLNIKVLNPLIDNDDTSGGVRIECFVHAKDVEVMKPNALGAKYYGTPISESSEEEMKYCCQILGSSVTDNNISLYHGGESVKSLRVLLKRFSGGQNMTNGATTTAPNVIQQLSLPYINYIPYSGDGTSDKVNQYSRSFIDLLRPGFLACRGGVRFKIFVYTDTNAELVMTKVRNSYAAPLLLPLTTQTGSLGMNQQFAFGDDGPLSNNPRGLQSDPMGTVTFRHDATGGIEVEAPYYTSRLWDFAQSYVASYHGSLNENGIEVTMLTNRKATSSGDTSATLGVRAITYSKAAAEDFTFLRFQGSPLWVYNHV